MMRFEKYALHQDALYHYTSKENAREIMREKIIRPGQDGFCFFAKSRADAEMLFRELMESPVSYIDDNLTVQKRVPQNPEDYVILKIEVRNDGQFYRFICDQDGFNPYVYSLLYRGALSFENAELYPVYGMDCAQKQEKDEAVQPLPRKMHRPVFRRLAAAGLLSAVLCMSALPVSAAGTNWLDAGNYDISWYEESEKSFKLSTPQQVAGLSYLANNGSDLSGKNFEIQNDIDLTAYEWVSIPESFKGSIDGIHKVVLALLSDSEPFAEGEEEFPNVSLRYTNNTTQICYSVAPSYTVTIPETVELEKVDTAGTVTYEKDMPVTAEAGVRLLKGQTIRVTLKSDFTMESSEDAVLPYTVETGGKAVADEGIVAVFESSSREQTSSLHFEAEEPEYAGDYSDTVTFTLSVVSE